MDSGDEFATPGAQQQHQPPQPPRQRRRPGPVYGGGSGGDDDEGNDEQMLWADDTPASRVAAAAVGRRLDLAPPPFALRAPPALNLGDQTPPASSSPVHSAFATPVVRQPGGHAEARGLDWGEQAADAEGASPAGGLAQPHAGDGPPTPFGVQAVDPDFVLNLNQEGDLERLTRRAVGEMRTAWKTLAMDALRKQVASIDDDEWVYSVSNY